jgi:branched-chain amino acid aminotransferase
VAGFKQYPYAYIRGEVVPFEQATVSLATNALHYGGGVFGGIKGVQTKDGLAIFRLDDHIARLAKSCRILRFPYEVDASDIKRVIKELVQKNKPTGTTYIRPLIYRSDTALSPSIEGDYDLAIYMLDMPNYFDPEKGTRVMVSSWQRNADNAIPPRTKATGGYINSALAIHEANMRGFDSAIMLDAHGNVSEGAVMNVFLMRDGVLVTPSTDSSILEGITRRTVLELAETWKLKVQERPVNRSELYLADEMFFCGTAANISWCPRVDDVTFGDKPGTLTQRFIEAFEKLPETHPELYTVVSR